MDENLIILNSGLKNNSIIYVDLKEPQQKLTIFVENKPIECMKFYLLSTLIENIDEFYNRSELYSFKLRCPNGEEDKILNKDLSIEKLGLKDNDFIYKEYRGFPFI